MFVIQKWHNNSKTCFIIPKNEWKCESSRGIQLEKVRNSCSDLQQESCAIAKMTAQCALYKWIEWVVAEIWPYETIKDGGLPPTWIWCNRKLRHSIRRPWKPYHKTTHEMYRITRCGDMAIRVSWGIWHPHFGGRGGRRGQRWHH